MYKPVIVTIHQCDILISVKDEGLPSCDIVDLDIFLEDLSKKHIDVNVYFSYSESFKRPVKARIKGRCLELVKDACNEIIDYVNGNEFLSLTV